MAKDVTSKPLEGNQRELTTEEREFLLALVSRCSPERLGEVDRLVVLASFGFEHCPDLLFGNSFADEPVTKGAYLIADLVTPPDRNGFFGVMLWATDSRITELEIADYSLSEPSELPCASSLQPFVAT
ncbi:MAG: hypothetical protein EOP50_06135 [Sphingobacteriales bacterium]|nr:MAG: hypothetical protein EOP50_06135 [Sphingobacteriales bacterium]